jgi:hypothetical protein
MSHVTVRISSTIGASAAAEANPWIRQAGPGTAIGWGHVVDTLGPDGGEAEALVVMHEPALAGVDVTVEPVAVLHLSDESDQTELLCVADDPNLTALIDAEGILPSDGPMQAWSEALARLASRPVGLSRPYGSRVEAEHLLEEEREAYLRSTGCLE